MALVRLRRQWQRAQCPPPRPLPRPMLPIRREEFQPFDDRARLLTLTHPLGAESPRTQVKTHGFVSPAEANFCPPPCRTSETVREIPARARECGHRSRLWNQAARAFAPMERLQICGGKDSWKNQTIKPVQQAAMARQQIT